MRPAALKPGDTIRRIERPERIYTVVERLSGLQATHCLCPDYAGMDGEDDRGDVVIADSLIRRAFERVPAGEGA